MRAASVIVVALLLALPAPLAAQPAGPPGEQAPDSLRGVVVKGKAPVSDEVLRVTLPAPAEVDLPNGAHLMVLEDRRLPEVSFQILIQGAGGYYDPADLPGLATFVASLLREGTSTRSSAEISERLERLAASLEVSSGSGSQIATISGSCLTEHLDELLALTADVLRDPAFPDTEIERYRQRTKALLVQQRTRPGFLASELFSRVLYGAHPAARISPAPDALDRLSRDALVRFHRERYVPDHAVIGVSGDISLAEARRALERHFGGWTKAAVPAPTVSEPEPVARGRVHLVERPGSVQTQLVVGTQAIDRTDPDYDVLSVLNKIVGGGPTGRLFLNLREDKGYTYGAYSGFSALRYRGLWRASTEVRTEVTEAALRELLGEIARVREEPVAQGEFQDAKRSMVAAFALSVESPEAILGNHVLRHLYGLPADYWDRLPERIAAVTPEQVRAAARKYLSPDRLHIVAVGDASQIRDVLAQFGPLDRYDTEGQRLASSGPD